MRPPADPELLLAEDCWTDWTRLRPGSDPQLPMEPGLYRIRTVGRMELDYVGQTGRGLRARLAQLKGAFGPEMPFNDPHTAGPGLWALRADEPRDYEVSSLPLAAGRTERMGLEALVVSLHRLRFGRSPTLNFGRMPTGWTKSRARSTGVRGKRSDSTRIPSLPPPDVLRQDPLAKDWLGQHWSLPVPLHDRSQLPVGRGVYRICEGESVPLSYVGQGRLHGRLGAHASRFGSGTSSLEASWVSIDIPTPQLLELENDLIASHVLTIGQPPRHQFGTDPDD